MARFRKTAIAALAVSAVALAPAAAYGHDHHGVSATSTGGMRWGYSGELKNYTTTTSDLFKLFKDARASAVMIGVDGRSYFRLRVSGIAATGGTYGVHLHQGTCDAKDSVAAGPHYNVTWDSIKLASGKVNKKTEVWLDLDVDSDGNAHSTATVSFIPDGKRSIVLHAAPTASDGTAGARLACMPFNIKAYGG